VYLSRCDHRISISLIICVHHQDRRGQRRIGLSHHQSNLYLAAGCPSSEPVESVMEWKSSPTVTPVRRDLLTDKATRGWFQSTAKCVCRCLRNHSCVLCCFYVPECWMIPVHTLCVPLNLLSSRSYPYPTVINAYIHFIIHYFTIL
jgi:hypothetical protein